MLVTLRDDLIVAVRSLKPEDRAYILRTWKECARHELGRLGVGKADAFDHLNATCDALLDAHGATLAVNPDDADQILGFVVSDRNSGAVCYAYTGKAFRRYGIMRTLLAGLSVPFRCLWWSPDIEAITTSSAGLEFIYRPYSAKGLVQK